MTCRPFFFVALSIARWAAETQAQVQEQIPRNPIVASITGTNAEPDLYREVNISTFELLTGSFQFKETDGSSKVVLAPFKLLSRYYPLLSETAFNLAQAKGITTAGVGIAYNSKSGFSKSAVADLEKSLNRMKPFRDQKTGESEEAYNLVRDAYLKNQWASIYDKFYTELARHAWMLSTAYNAKTFGILAGDTFDADEDGIIDNFHRLKGYDIGVTVTYTADQKTGITVAGHYGKRRESAKEDSDVAPYRGWSLAFARRVRDLNPNYRTSADYLKSLFIPAILLGGTLESERCNGRFTTCEERLRSRRSLTPFVELKITPQAQFRIGVPIRRSVVFGGKSKTELAAALQYAIQLNGVK